MVPKGPLGSNWPIEQVPPLLRAFRVRIASTRGRGRCWAAASRPIGGGRQEPLAQAPSRFVPNRAGPDHPSIGGTTGDPLDHGVARSPALRDERWGASPGAQNGAAAAGARRDLPRYSGAERVPTPRWSRRALAAARTTPPGRWGRAWPPSKGEVLQVAIYRTPGFELDTASPS